MLINIIRTYLTMSSETDLNHKLKSILRQALVKEFLQGNERPCDKKDFLETRDSLEKFTSQIKEMIESVENYHFSYKSSEEFNKSVDNESLTLLLILCGQNSSSQYWNTEATQKNCKVIFSQILQLFNCKDSFDLFSRYCRINLVKNTLQILCSDLTKSTWKHFPASVVCYSWILKMIKQPELSQYLGLVLPPALLLTDDFVTENRIIGVQCLNHIIHNITIAELQLYGHGEVIYNALIPILRIREIDLIESTVLPLVSLSNKLEFDLGKKHPTKWSRFDNILEIYLESMELEQMIDMRNCYIKNLSILVTNTRYNIIRWSVRLLRIFDEYVQTAGKYNDEKTTYHCVKAIKEFIQLTKEAMFLYDKHLLFTLLMALYSISSLKSDIQNETLEITIECIKKLKGSCIKTETKELKKGLINNFSGTLNSKKFCNQICEILENN